MLFDAEGKPWSTGCTTAYVGEHEWFPGQPPLTLAFECIVGTNVPQTHTAFLDTGATFSMVSADVAQTLGDELGDEVERTALHSRFGRSEGGIYRIPFTISAREGIDLELNQVRTFVPDDFWPGPSVIVGMQGFLDRIRFALLPSVSPDGVSTLYFGAL